VQLADYRVQWFDDQQCQGLAAFDIEPAGLTEVTLAFPLGLELVNVAVGTIPVSAEQVSEQHWRVPVGMASVPQRIEVLFHGSIESLDKASQTIALNGPVIADLPCSETLWTVQGPARFGPGMPVLSHTWSSRVDLATRRLETARKLIDSAPIGISREGSNHAESWRTNRQQWLKQLEADLFQATSSEDRSTAVSSRRIVASALTSPRYDISGSWSLPGTSAGPIVCGVLRGTAGRFEIRYPHSAWRMYLNSLIAVVILVGLFAILRRGLRIEWLRETLVCYPHFAVAVVGFGWWLWLSPSVVGLAMIVLTGALSLRTPWKTRAA
jgi:hypothetical protein